MDKNAAPVIDQDAGYWILDTGNWLLDAGHWMLVARFPLLEVMETELVPQTQQGVNKGNKVFGAAILRKSDLSLMVAGANHETENPVCDESTQKGFRDRIEKLKKVYAQMSEIYQKNKGDSDIPLK